jgi:hypothetical protein
VNCVVFERDLFPREHVGESFVPATTRVFKELGFLDQMDASGSPRKFGAVWSADADAKQYDHEWEGLTPDCLADIRFEEREQEGVPKNYTWHVDRGKVDLAYLQHANSLGAKVYSGVRIDHVDLDDEDCASIRYRVGRKEVSTRVKMVVDASGRKTQEDREYRLRSSRTDGYGRYAARPTGPSGGRAPAIEGPMGDSARAAMLGSVLPAFWNFMLAARARELGTCWTTLHLFGEQEVAEILGIPYDEVMQTALSPVAYTVGTDFKPAKGRGLETALHVDTW